MILVTVVFMLSADSSRYFFWCVWLFYLIPGIKVLHSSHEPFESVLSCFGTSQNKDPKHQLQNRLGKLFKLFNLDANLAAYTTAMVLGLKERHFNKKRLPIPLLVRWDMTKLTQPLFKRSDWRCLSSMAMGWHPYRTRAEFLSPLSFRRLQHLSVAVNSGDNRKEIHPTEVYF